MPVESVWADILMKELLVALRAQWHDDIDDDPARARSAWILDLLDTRGWAHRAAPNTPDITERYRAEMLVLLMNTEASFEARKRYWKWLDDAALLEFKNENPGSYRELVKSVEGVIMNRLSDAPYGGKNVE